MVQQQEDKKGREAAVGVEIMRMVQHKEYKEGRKAVVGVDNEDGSTPGV